MTLFVRSSGELMGLLLRARAGPKLVEGLVSLSTGIVPAADTLVDASGFTPNSSRFEQTAGRLGVG